MFLASMGNYIFRTSSLLEALERDAVLESSAHDFGRDIVPTMVTQGAKVMVYDFQTNKVPGEDETSVSYWRDIGTIEAYWSAQIDLVAVKPAFNLYNRRWPIRTGMNHDPPAKFVHRDEGGRTGVATESLVSMGCIISGGKLHRSVLSNRCRINSFSEIEDCILFENVVIGRHAKIRRAIINKDVEIPPNTLIGYDLEDDKKRYFVSEEGIIVIRAKSRTKIGAPTL